MRSIMKNQLSAVSHQLPAAWSAVLKTTCYFVSDDVSFFGVSFGLLVSDFSDFTTGFAEYPSLYQPPPLSMKLVAERMRSAVAPHFGHGAIGGSEIFCMHSKCLSQPLQAYS
jgi:hypothetical protein